jgi:NUMOD4 motif-containing protein/DNA endonuclease I-like protein/HNH endonuclease
MDNINVEIWRSVVGYEALYEVSNKGLIRSKQRLINSTHRGIKFKKNVRERILKPFINKLGYCRVGLHKNGKMKIITVHKIVAIAFIENPENKRTINHINGNPSDNRVENLEWNTHKENIIHSFKVLGRKGSALGRNKEKCWLYGKRGAAHPGFGNTYSKGKKGFLSHRGKAVKCDTLDIIFGSGNDAANELGLHQASISAVCSGKKIHTGGFSFRYI